MTTAEPVEILHGRDALDVIGSESIVVLSIVVPTFNERENVPLLVDRLALALRGLRWEIIFVDDASPDGTAEAARHLARRDARVRVIERIGRRGLSSAIVEGVMSSSAPFFAVMDADLQHDESKLAEMFEQLRAENLDVVVGSRYLERQDDLGLSPRRRDISLLATKVSRLVCKADLADPMSGYFVMRRSAFDALAPRLSQQGFKILLDIFASAQTPLRYGQVPCRFAPRVHGESKLDTMAAWDFGMLILDKLVGGVAPPQFVMFSMVGGTGLLIHLGCLVVAKSLGAPFMPAQALAVVTAMTWNFFLNNLITYRDRRLTGFRAVAKGLLAFYAVCSLGALANVGIADLVFSWRRAWLFSGFAGALVGAAWNFAASRYTIWKSSHQRRAPRKN